MSIQLTQEILNKLFGMYKEVTGSAWEDSPQIDDVLSYLNQNGIYELRAGSMWSGHSKFIIDHGRVEFYANCYQDYDAAEVKKIKAAETLFKKRVEKYVNTLVGKS